MGDSAAHNKTCKDLFWRQNSMLRAGFPPLRSATILHHSSDLRPGRRIDRRKAARLHGEASAAEDNRVQQGIAQGQGDDQRRRSGQRLPGQRTRSAGRDDRDRSRSVHRAIADQQHGVSRTVTPEFEGCPAGTFAETRRRHAAGPAPAPVPRRDRPIAPVRRRLNGARRWGWGIAWLRPGNRPRRRGRGRCAGGQQGRKRRGGEQGAICLHRAGMESGACNHNPG